MTSEVTDETVNGEAKTSTMGRRALFGLGLGALASLVVSAGAAEAAVLVVRRRPVVVARPWRRRVIVVR